MKHKNNELARSDQKRIAPSFLKNASQRAAGQPIQAHKGSGMTTMQLAVERALRGKKKEKSFAQRRKKERRGRKGRRKVVIVQAEQAQLNSTQLMVWSVYLAASQAFSSQLLASDSILYLAS